MGKLPTGKSRHGVLLRSRPGGSSPTQEPRCQVEPGGCISRCPPGQKAWLESQLGPGSRVTSGMWFLHPQSGSENGTCLWGRGP